MTSFFSIALCATSVKPGMGIVESRPRLIDEVHDLTAEKAIKTSSPN
jgi:hypothetical protein